MLISVAISLFSLTSNDFAHNASLYRYGPIYYKLMIKPGV